MKIEAFDFDLPRELIAQRPAVPRDSARLLHVGATLADRSMRDLTRLLTPGDIAVFNNTRVIPARLIGHRGGARIELTLHRHIGEGRWRAFARPARRLKRGDRVNFARDFAADVVDRPASGEITLCFPVAEAELLDRLKRHGRAPLPPYIRREQGPDMRDLEDYQTVFATEEGAIAAPTAGLHFTREMLEALDARGVRRVAVTLHVGIGTFLPVRVVDVRDHRMHAEVGFVSKGTAEAVNDARAAGSRVLAVGTTSVRLLETATDERGRVHPFSGETDLFVLPGYRFKAVDLMLTNFHLPRSTLFMLVSAFAGLDRMRAAYEHAKHEGYRFYSYGDCCLLERQEAG
jgi:S-adenosylmethionine:tRNA ribosyltransferase-isomerase